MGADGNSMLRVCVLTGSVSRIAGGLFFSVRELTRALSRTGAVDVEVWSVRDGHTQEDAPLWAPVRLRTFDPSGRGGFGLSLPMLRAFRKARFDLVHVHGLWGFPSLLAQVAVARGIPVVISPRGMLDPWILGRRSWVKRVYAAVVERRIIQKASVLHALTEAEESAIRLLGLARRIVTIPNGVCRPETAVGHGSTVGEKVLLYIGRFHEKKGLLEFLTAWASIDAGARAGWTLEIFGWGSTEYESQLRQACRELGLVDECLIGGAVYGAEKESALRRATAFFLPTKSEGLPMAVLEAWAYGLPVLMTVNANLSIGFDRGAALDLGANQTDFREALYRFLGLTHDALTRMGQRGNDLVRTEYDWDLIALSMLQVYRDATAPRDALD